MVDNTGTTRSLLMTGLKDTGIFVSREKKHVMCHVPRACVDMTNSGFVENCAKTGEAPRVAFSCHLLFASIRTGQMSSPAYSYSRSAVITVFSSIRDIVPALRRTSLPLQEIEDPVLSAGTSTSSGASTFWDVNIGMLQESTKERLANAEILITEPVLLAQLWKHSLIPKLKWCQSTYAGVDPLLGLSLPFVVTRFAGVFGPPIAEWCLAQIIGHERQFTKLKHYQQQRQWKNPDPDNARRYRYLSELTLTILGVGDIGLCIARVAKAFGMTVVGYSKHVKKLDDEGSKLPLDQSVTDLTTAMQAADYIISVLPSTFETRNLLTLEQFAVCHGSQGGKVPVFINVGRGDVTDSTTLMEALNQNYISAAILDVVEQEPLPETNPLWTHPQVTITPHVSGLTRAQDIPNLMVDQYERYVQGKSLQFVVHWNKGY